MIFRKKRIAIILLILQSIINLYSNSLDDIYMKFNSASAFYKVGFVKSEQREKIYKNMVDTIMKNQYLLDEIIIFQQDQLSLRDFIKNEINYYYILKVLKIDSTNIFSNYIDKIDEVLLMEYHLSKNSKEQDIELNTLRRDIENEINEHIEQIIWHALTNITFDGFTDLTFYCQVKYDSVYGLSETEFDYYVTYGTLLDEKISALDFEHLNTGIHLNLNSNSYIELLKNDSIYAVNFQTKDFGFVSFKFQESETKMEFIPNIGWIKGDYAKFISTDGYILKIFYSNHNQNTYMNIELMSDIALSRPSESFFTSSYDFNIKLEY